MVVLTLPWMTGSSVLWKLFCLTRPCIDDWALPPERFLKVLLRRAGCGASVKSKPEFMSCDCEKERGLWPWP